MTWSLLSVPVTKSVTEYRTLGAGISHFGESSDSYSTVPAYAARYKTLEDPFGAGVAVPKTQAVAAPQFCFPSASHGKRAV